MNNISQKKKDGREHEIIDLGFIPHYSINCRQYKETKQNLEYDNQDEEYFNFVFLIKSHGPKIANKNLNICKG